MLTGEDLRLGMNLRSLGGHALPDLSSVQLLFTTVPDGAIGAAITIRTKGITIRPDGNAPTASANGLDLGVNSTTVPHYVWGNAAKLMLVKAVQQEATAAGWIEYYGLDAGN